MSERKKRSVKSVAGYRLSNISRDALIQKLVESNHIFEPPGLDVHFLNASSIYYGARDPLVKEMYEKSSVLVADGKPLASFARLRGLPIRQIRGPGLLNDVLEQSQVAGTRHFFLGTTEATLRLIDEKIKHRYPQAVCVGFMSPPFREQTREEQLQQDQVILSAAPDIVWIGISSPKQDFEAQRLAHTYGLSTIAVGAAFDFLAGTQAEAPKIMRALGLEWFFRLITNPRRLWKRYLVGNAVFLRELVRHF